LVCDGTASDMLSLLLADTELVRPPIETAL
jgi:hypothetical protein